MEEVVVREEEMVGLVGRFARLKSTGQAHLILREVEGEDCHLGDLPTEVLNYILKWVVSSELDMR